MANYTITYSPRAQGWTSFHSYQPEWMVTMNNFMYSFKNGNLYKHNTNVARNTYYGTYYPSKITSIFNDDPDQPKSFKTLSTNSNVAWSANVHTDTADGMALVTDFSKQENVWYAYIRRNANDMNLSLTSAQGLGNVTSYAAGVLQFPFSIDSIISDGDTLYWVNAGNLQLIGPVTAHNDTSVSVTVTGTAPTAGAFVLFLKNSQAESYPPRGTYMSVELTNTDTGHADIFALETDAFKSFP